MKKAEVFPPVLSKGLSLGPVQLLQPLCGDCGVRGDYWPGYRKVVCPDCGKVLDNEKVITK